MNFPEPVIRVAIEPKTKAGSEKMGIALAKLAEEDPTFRTWTDEETGQTIIAGMGELHLEIIVDRLLREFKVEANVGAPQVAYRETIRKEANQETKYARQSGGKGQYGHVKIKLEPNPGKGYEFVNGVVGGAIPKEYIPAVDNGIQGAMKSGVLAGYPVVEIEEGECWEAFMFANHYKLDNLCIMIDVNGLQIDGATRDVMNSEPLDHKMDAFGFNTIVCNGNSFSDLEQAFKMFDLSHGSGKPTCFLLRTTKGLGVSFMENAVDWHGKAPNDEEYAQAMTELRAAHATLEKEIEFNNG